jgi:Ni2+-binding GTPase involved in maturation of urease and hydrogenase
MKCCELLVRTINIMPVPGAGKTQIGQVLEEMVREYAQYNQGIIGFWSETHKASTTFLTLM